jgi:7-keto-8-aminopelargonate synthetase-like enzyme
MIIEGFPDRLITFKGEEYLYFGGTSYLGMASLNKFQRLITENIKKWGTFYGSSRNANIKLSIYEQFEALFSEQISSQSSLVTSSGTLAGKLVIDQLTRSNSVFYHYPKTHPSILSHNSLPLFINNQLHPKLIDNISEEIIITADAILSLEVKPTTFDFINHISPKKKITLVIDESHSLGIVGRNGFGIFKSINNEKLHRKIMISSLGKALGISGGIVAGDSTFINTLKNHPLFVSSSGANPAYLATYVEAQNLYREQRGKLKNNLAYLNAKLQLDKDFIFTHNYPVIYSNNDAIFTTLLRHNVIITRFKYPTYEVPMNRIVITANHIKTDLDKLTQLIHTNYDQ